MKKDYQDLSQMKTEVVDVWKSFDTTLCFRRMSSVSEKSRAVIEQCDRRIAKNGFLDFSSNIKAVIVTTIDIHSERYVYLIFVLKKFVLNIQKIEMYIEKIFQNFY